MDNDKAKGEKRDTQAVVNVALQAEISERLLVESQLTEQREFLQSIIESLTHPFYVIDATTYSIVLANAAAYALSKRPCQNLTCYAMTHDRDTPCSGDDHLCALAMVKKRKKPVTVEHIHYDHDGGGRYFEIHAYPLLDADGNVKQVIEYNIDITERRRAEEERKAMWAQLLQSQKMEAVGLLAGGVAHDFNNILTAIIGNVQLAMLKSAAGHGGNSYLEQILTSSNRAAGLVRQLLLFSRRQADENFGPVDLNHATENILPMLQRLIGEDITISVDLAPGIWTINGDGGSIEQLLTNLIVNARDAMPDGGTIVITTKNLGIDQDLGRQIHNARLGDYVALSIADTGNGIAKKDLDRIFDPFYTTKPEGKGTGLGLSIVSGIVAQHDGWVNVYSEPGQGTVFNIYLPAVTGKEGRGEAMDAMAAWHDADRGEVAGDGRLVLLIEDEADVRKVAQRMLEAKGFQVMAAADSDTARKIFDREGHNIDLLFSDVTLPDGNGIKLAREFLARTPQLKVLITSGYPDHRSRLELLKERKLRFIQKPYGVMELDRALIATLSE